MNGQQFQELATNKAVEDAAIAFVIEHERQQGRTANDTRHRGAPADVKSDDRLIEVKAAGRSARGQDLWLEVRQVQEARANPNFHVYVVDNVRQGDPRQFGLIDLHSETLATLLVRAKEKHYFTVPLPVSVYDAQHQGPLPGVVEPETPTPAATSQVDDLHVQAMTRTDAILYVLASRSDSMRPIEVYHELRRLGRGSDPKGEVSTTMFDLWKAARIGKAGRGLYYALGTAV